MFKMFVPGEHMSNKTQIHGSTLIKHIAKSLLLAMWSCSSPYFFRLLCNFIEVPSTNPWSLPSWFQISQLPLSFMSSLCIWLTIKYSKMSFLCFIYCAIYVILRKSLNCKSKSSFQKITNPPTLFLLGATIFFLKFKRSWTRTSLASFVHVSIINTTEKSFAHTISTS